MTDPTSLPPDPLVQTWLVQGSGISITYQRGERSTLAVHDIDLALRPGEFVGLVGPSGCGKSTLLRVFGGLLRPSAGRLAWSDAAAGRRANTVFQEDGLFPWMTVLDNVAFGLRVRGVEREERRARALVELQRLGLERFAKAYPSELSGGMRQRANIGRAFANDPVLLLMDEPFAALDVQTRSLMQEQLLARWEADHRTVLFVTHGIEEVILLSDRVLVMGIDPGTIIAEIPVPFARPRDLSALRHDPDLQAMAADIWATMRPAVLAQFAAGRS